MPKGHSPSSGNHSPTTGPTALAVPSWTTALGRADTGRANRGLGACGQFPHPSQGLDGHSTEAEIPASEQTRPLA